MCPAYLVVQLCLLWPTEQQHVLAGMDSTMCAAKEGLLHFTLKMFDRGCAVGIVKVTEAIKTSYYILQSRSSAMKTFVIDLSHRTCVGCRIRLTIQT